MMVEGEKKLGGQSLIKTDGLCWEMHRVRRGMDIEEVYESFLDQLEREGMRDPWVFSISFVGGE